MRGLAPVRRAGLASCATDNPSRTVPVKARATILALADVQPHSARRRHSPVGLRRLARHRPGGCGRHNGEHNAPASQFVTSDSAAARRSRAARPLPPKSSSGCGSAASSAMSRTRPCLGVRSASRRASRRGTGAHNGGCVDLRVRLVRSCVLSSAISFHDWFPYLVVMTDLSCIIAIFGSIISFHNERRI